RYVDGKAQVPPEPAAPSVDDIPPVWVSTRAARRAELYQLLKDLGAKVETGQSPSPQALTLVAPLGFDVTTVAVVERLDPARPVETAVTLGLGYPLGPLAIGDRWGPTNVLEVLFNMQTVYGDPRYRPSPWLRRRGAIGLSLLQEES